MTTTALPAEPLHPGTLAAGKLDVAGYLQRWLAHARGRVRAVTYEGYEVLLGRHALPRLGHLRLRELSPLVIQELYSELLAGSAEMTVQPALLLDGTLLDVAGQLIPSAEVIIQRGSGERKYLRTDAKGHFQAREVLQSTGFVYRCRWDPHEH